MTLLVPVAAVPSQTLTVQLGAQSCRINIYEKATGLFVDLYVSDVAVITGALALNLNRLVRSAYLGFDGDLYFYDTRGSSDPSFAGLGSRFVLLWTGG
jgi:hypothetical protein